MAKRLSVEAKIIIERSCKRHGLRAVSFQKERGGETMLISFQRPFGRTATAVKLHSPVVDDDTIFTAIKTAGGPLAALAYRNEAGA